MRKAISIRGYKGCDLTSLALETSRAPLSRRKSISKSLYSTSFECWQRSVHLTEDLGIYFEENTR